jgi:hypothetical protein
MFTIHQPGRGEVVWIDGSAIVHDRRVEATMNCATQTGLRMNQRPTGAAKNDLFKAD